MSAGNRASAPAAKRITATAARTGVNQEAPERRSSIGARRGAPDADMEPASVEALRLMDRWGSTTGAGSDCKMG